MPSISVIISTYNQPDFLELVLLGYSVQTFKDFEIIIADDGSDNRTVEVINSFKSKQSIKIKHVWQEDRGFRKTRILNKAVALVESDYILFTDGDCIPRDDFIAVHMALRQPKTALSGGYFRLNMKVSSQVTQEIIVSQKCFNLDWLLKNGQQRTFKMTKLWRSSFVAALLNSFTTTKATFDGMNVSCWLEDFVKVNGFDERMAYGGEDREVGERMMNNGISFRQIRYSAICVHLYHHRPYKKDDMLMTNKAIRKETREKRATWTPFGIKQD